VSWPQAIFTGSVFALAWIALALIGSAWIGAKGQPSDKRDEFPTGEG
jgi:hypothetical protein